jgi:hypothetical protein
VPTFDITITIKVLFRELTSKSLAAICATDGAREKISILLDSRGMFSAEIFESSTVLCGLSFHWRLFVLVCPG